MTGVKTKVIESYSFEYEILLSSTYNNRVYKPMLKFMLFHNIFKSVLNVRKLDSIKKYRIQFEVSGIEAQE